MVNAASLAAMAFRKPADKSKAAISSLALRPVSLAAARLGSPEVAAPSTMMVSMPASESRAALTLARTSAGSLPVGSTLDLPAKPSAKPLQRRSRATLPTSWLTQMPFLPPMDLSFSPADLPASYSDWPTWSTAPSFLENSSPELIGTTGIPALTSRSMAGPRADASGSETTRPSGFWLTAASISRLIATMSKLSGARYLTLTPASLPPASTPFLTTDQNASLAWPWVTTAMVWAWPQAHAADSAAANAQRTSWRAKVMFLS